MVQMKQMTINKRKIAKLKIYLWANFSYLLKPSKLMAKVLDNLPEIGKRIINNDNITSFIPNKDEVKIG